MILENQLVKRCMCIIYALAGLALNIVHITDNNWGGDQAFSIKLARMNFTGMIGITANDVHPPMYYIFLMLANRLFGDHGWVYHLVSIIPLICNDLLSRENLQEVTTNLFNYF